MGVKSKNFTVAPLPDGSVIALHCLPLLMMDSRQNICEDLEMY